MKHALFLALRCVAFHKAKTAILIACLSLTVFLPIVANLLIRRFEQQLMSRAAATPLVIGAKGSRFDLVLHALYFDAEVPESIAWREVDFVQSTDFAQPIPLNIRYRARGFPIVGTSLAYFEFRQLRLDQGHRFTRLGDCVIGATVARRLRLTPGDALLSDPENVFDLAGSYPLKMRVVGVLAETNSADDQAVLVDVKTAWIIAGLGHGHQDLAGADDQVLLDRSPQSITASAALMHYTEITDENLASFHFHGDTAAFPLTAVIAVPRDAKSATLLVGRYQRDEATAQILVPANIVQQLMQMVFRVKRFFDAAAVLVAVATLLFTALVVLLSLRLRRREMETMFKLGCSRLTIARLIAAELSIVIAASLLLALTASLLVSQYSAQLVRQWIF